MRHNLYTRYRNQGGGVTQPTLQDLHDELQDCGNDEGRYLADALNPYITGSMSGFNGQTNATGSPCSTCPACPASSARSA